MAAVAYIAWAVAVVVLGAMALSFGLAYLKRRSDDFTMIDASMNMHAITVNQRLGEMKLENAALRGEIEERDKLWVKEFEGHVEFVAKRCERVESHTKANDTTFMPLGKAYSTRL